MEKRFIARRLPTSLEIVWERTLLNLVKRSGLAIAVAITLLGAAILPLKATTLTAEPTDALCDDPVSIAVTGLHPGEKITLISSATSADGSEWRGEGAFAAGDDGRVDLKRDRPLRGSYCATDSMGLFWSIQPPPKTKTLFAYPPDLKPLAIKVVAQNEQGEDTGTVTLIRRQIAPAGVAQKAVNDGNLVGALFYPEDGKKHAGILLLGGSEGGFEKDAFPALLASHGYAVLSLAYFGIEPLPKSLVEVPVETVQRGIDYLSRQPVVSAENGIAVIGSSRGAELALIAATLNPKTRAVVALVPTAVVFAGLEFGRGPVDKSPWTIGGKPVPYITFATWKKYLASRDASLIKDAEIPVEKIAAPILFVGGGDDQLGLSGVMTHLAKDRLAWEKHPFADQFLVYPKVGHLILFPPFQPTANTIRLETPYGVLDFGGSPEGNAAAATDAWPKLLRFLDGSVRSPSNHN